ncbi:FAD-dependent oxidoreductase [Paenibacillus sabinae]|uniref:NADH:flavin oxidoreductase n=1 Tax=Paenibacillus sabinae T27 TaxID=1268072 RepID=X5A1S3_9BACL|nr:FAD-dependent oxidoreductase [Paenibacillus sabinae]AHV97779.1 NADH:flavin oxidoreductase [Paenibacillus sabinae T27]
MFTKIFEPGKIGNLEIKNRLVVPPMLTEYAAEDGKLTERYIRYYEEKAKGGWGLIIAEDNAVEPRGAGFKNIAGLWSDDLMKEHKELVERVHNAGAKIAVQIYHAGREASSTIMGMRPIAPSAIQDPTQSETPVEMTTDEVKEMIEKFAQAIRRCKEAGYDAIELHGAHGYLINQFVSPFSNKRTDAYGGNLMNRLRFPLEIIARAKELVGEEFPMIYRISADEMVEGGLTIEDTKVISQVLEQSGVAAIHASAGVYKSGSIVSAPTAIRTAVFSDYAKEIRKVVNIPVFAVNKIIYPHVAESILKEGKADFVAMGRASIADPQFPNKVKEGRLDEIIFCIGCRQGCQWRIAQQNPVSCLVNPLTGKEGEYELKEAEVKKKVMVIGGGPVGMEAAIVAAKRGHDVTLYDKSDKLGGQWLLAAIPPGKELLNTFTVWQKGELDRSGVKVVLNTEVTKEFVEQVNPDEIILASGAAPIIPGIPGADKSHVYTANDVLLGKVDLPDQAVVIGGGLVGAETAEHIAVHNRKTSIVEMRPEIAADMEPASKEFLMKSLKHNEVAVHVNSKVLEITDTHVIIDTEQGQQALPASLVVLAIGSRSNNALASELGEKYNVNVIGDAAVVGKALEGINLAYKTALAI